MNSLILYNHSIDSYAISLSHLNKITADRNCPDVDKLIVVQHRIVSKLLIPLPLVFTVGANTCVHSDSLDWVIDYTPHFLLSYIENQGPVKLYNMQSLSDTLTLLLS